MTHSTDSCCSSNSSHHEEKQSCCQSQSPDSYQHHVAHESDESGCCGSTSHATSCCQSSSTNKPGPTHVHREMIIGTILSKFPHRSAQLAQLITKAGLHCIGCGAATWETLEAGMISHGKTNEEIDALVDELNELLQRPLMPDTITLTPQAAQKFHQIALEDGKQGASLRFGDRAGGCSGFEYILDFCEDKGEDDICFESHGIEIVVNRYSIDRLLGSEIDYLEGLYGAGFKISNPNSGGGCGCGNSHNY